MPLFEQLLAKAVNRSLKGVMLLLLDRVEWPLKLRARDDKYLLLLLLCFAKDADVERHHKIMIRV